MAAGGQLPIGQQVVSGTFGGALSVGSGLKFDADTGCSIQCTSPDLCSDPLATSSIHPKRSSLRFSLAPPAGRLTFRSSAVEVQKSRYMQLLGKPVAHVRTNKHACCKQSRSFQTSMTVTSKVVYRSQRAAPSLHKCLVSTSGYPSFPTTLPP